MEARRKNEIYTSLIVFQDTFHVYYFSFGNIRKISIIPTITIFLMKIYADMAKSLSAQSTNDFFITMNI